MRLYSLKNQSYLNEDKATCLSKAGVIISWLIKRRAIFLDEMITGGRVLCFASVSHFPIIIFICEQKLFDFKNKNSIGVCNLEHSVHGKPDQWKQFIVDDNLQCRICCDCSLIIIIMSALSHGSIELILGPMFSGKSSELLRRLRRYEHAAKKCVAINYFMDNRYQQDECVATHDKITRQAIKTDRLAKLIQHLLNYEVIGIDEGQFFPDISQVSEELANQGRIVIVAALDSTFERKPFENIISLVPLAETLQKLSAVCVFCYKEASFTLRTTPSKQIELIGGQEIYKPVCRKCYYSQNPNK